MGSRARFSLLTQSGQEFFIPNHLLLQHFSLDLSKESSIHLDVSARGLFTHKTMVEGREILDRI